MSKFLSNSALHTINRMGDLMLPASGDFSSFSQTGCIEHIDDILLFAPEDDISSLNTLLSIMSVFPGSLLKWIIRNMETSHTKNGGISVLFRQLDFGLKGIIFTCYYSGKTGKHFTGKNPLQVIDFEFNRVMD